MCLRGASAIDRLLAEFPDAPLKAFVVWEPVLTSDFAAPMTRVLGRIRDHRVAQYWDPERVLSSDLVRAVNSSPPRYGFEGALPPDFVAWDVVAVFSRSDEWEGDVPVPAYYSGPVVGAIDGARSAIARALAP